MADERQSNAAKKQHHHHQQQSPDSAHKPSSAASSSNNPSQQQQQQSHQNHPPQPTQSQQQQQQQSQAMQQSQSLTTHPNQNPNFDSNVISERVKNLATQIYQELKQIISRCNYDEDILSGLMPLIVRVLESLDLAIIENQQLQVELELCKDDNDQIMAMFEKEKAAKRAIDNKLIESEYAYEEERQQYQQKIDSLDNQVKMYELKTKNAIDQAARLEEKESERKKEYAKLHDRYTELLKSHCDVVERVRHLTGNSDQNLGSINVPQQMVASNSDLTISDLPTTHHSSKMKIKSDDVDFGDRHSAVSTKTRESLKSWNAETELTLEDASLVVIEDMLESQSKTGDISSHNESDRATVSEPEGEHEKESENDSIAYTSMEKEFRKLIQENKDLLNTKNALNVVKDDLIAEVDRLTNEVSMYEQAVEQLNATKDQMKQRVSSLDAELRKTKEELEKAKQKIRENNEEGVPYSQKKRFGRAEMAKVLMERNNYKERFMELQDAVRYSEIVRANKVETEKRSGLWKFFSNLFGAPPREPLAIGPGSSRNASPVVAFHGPATATSAIASPDQQVSSGTMTPDGLQSAVAIRGSSMRPGKQRLSSNTDLIVLMDSDLNVDRSRAFREARFGNSDPSSGYIHAYGWSLPVSSLRGLTGAGGTGSPDTAAGSRASSVMGGTSSVVTTDNALITGTSTETSVNFNKPGGVQVPIPQYCRPLTGDSLGMKIWCATSIDLSGGDAEALLPTDTDSRRPNTTDALNTTNNSSGSMVNISSSTPRRPRHQQNALRELEQEVDQAMRNTSIGSDGSAARTSFGLDTGEQRPIIKATTEMILSQLPKSDEVEELSSCVWICSTQHSRSKITIIDIKTKPNDLLDSFYVPTFLYCIKSIPGSKPSDLLGIHSSKMSKQLAAEQQEQSDQEHGLISGTMSMLNELISTQKRDFYKLVEVDIEAQNNLRKARMELARKSASPKAEGTSPSRSSAHRQSSKQEAEEDDAEIARILDSDVSDGIATLQKLHDFVAHTQPQEPMSCDTSASVNTEDQKATGGEANSGLAQANDELSTIAAQSEVTTTPRGSIVANMEIDCQDAVYYQPISTCLSTVWMGGRDCILYIHSAIGQWKDCVACVMLPDSILQICHFKGRVFVALADGSICVFFRNAETKQWEVSQYLLIDINLMSEVTSGDTVDLSNDPMPLAARTSTPAKTSMETDGHAPIDLNTTTIGESSLSLSQQIEDSVGLVRQVPVVSPVSHASAVKASKSRSKVAGIRCLEIANRNLWVGYRNQVLIIDPVTLRLKHTFNVVPQLDNQIRQIVSMKDGVFVCLRSDLILRLYSSIKPYHHIQNIDIEPVVTRLMSPKTFVISHITAMRVADNTLWIGNAHGIVLTIPCKLVSQISEAPVRGTNAEETPSSLSIARFVPKCDITNAQISFHGHKDAVKFFVMAHGLMLSGGQGYLDFRLDMDDQCKSISDKSHLILWRLPQA